MGIVEELNKINGNLRIALISTAVLMPFFYLAFYLINSSFFINGDLILKTIICFCFSIYWVLTTGIFIHITFKDSDREEDYIESWGYSSFVAFFIINSVLVLRYCSIIPISKKFVIISFIITPVILLILGGLIYGFKYYRKKHKHVH